MARMVSTTLAFVAMVLSCSISSVICQTARGQTQKAQDLAASLYSSIRAVAYPESPELDEEQANVDTRFILMNPGKILNYFDYYPGPEYTEFIQVQAYCHLLSLVHKRMMFS